MSGLGNFTDEEADVILSIQRAKNLESRTISTNYVRVGPSNYKVLYVSGPQGIQGPYGYTGPTGNTGPTGVTGPPANPPGGGPRSIQFHSDSGAFTGTNDFVFNSSNQIEGPSGGPTLPSYTFSGNVDTGMYSSSPGELSISTAGKLMMNMSDNGLEMGESITSHSFGVERDSSGAGSNLTITAGGSASGSTDTHGGDLILRSGVSTGTGASRIFLQSCHGSSSGTSDSKFTDRMVFCRQYNVPLPTSQGVEVFTDIATFTLGQGEYFTGVAHIHAYATNGSDVAVGCSDFLFSVCRNLVSPDRIGTNIGATVAPAGTNGTNIDNIGVFITPVADGSPPFKTLRVRTRCNGMVPTTYYFNLSIVYDMSVADLVFS